MSISMEELFDELIEHQKTKLYRLGQEFVPNLTTDDILQPNDFPQLELNPLFRYEEGVLEGIHTARLACLQLLKR